MPKLHCQHFDIVGWMVGRASGLNKLSSEVLAWLSVCSELQMICIWSSGCYCYPLISCFTNIQNGLPLTPSVLWRCWLGGRKSIRPVKNWVVGCCGCLGWGADLHIAQQMPLPLTVSCSSKSRLVLTFLVLPFWYLLTRVVPDRFQQSSKTVVCVCVLYVFYSSLPYPSFRFLPFLSPFLSLSSVPFYSSPLTFSIVPPFPLSNTSSPALLFPHSLPFLLPFPLFPFSKEVSIRK